MSLSNPLPGSLLHFHLLNYAIPRSAAAWSWTHLMKIILAAPWNSTYYHSVSELCRESHFQNPVTLQGELDVLPFRNEYCALGNGVDITDIECFVSSHVQSGAGGIEPFAIILDLFTRGRVAMGSQRITRTSSIQFDVSCSKATEVYDPAIGKCHPTISAPVDDSVNSTNASSCSEKLITLTDTDAFEYVSTDMLLITMKSTQWSSTHPMALLSSVLISLPTVRLLRPLIFFHSISLSSIQYPPTWVALCQ